MAQGWDNSAASTAKVVGPTLVVPTDKVMAQGGDNSTAKVVGPTLVVPTDKVMAQGWDNSTASTAKVVGPTLVVPTLGQRWTNQPLLSRQCVVCFPIQEH